MSTIHIYITAEVALEIMDMDNINLFLRKSLFNLKLHLMFEV